MLLKVIIIIINPLTETVVGVPQIISQPVSSIFPCSPLPYGTWSNPGLSIPWCCLLLLRLFTMVRRSSCGPIACWILARTSSLVTWSLYEMSRILREHLISMACVLLWSSAVSMLKIILHRLKPQAEKIVAEEQAGFRAGSLSDSDLRILCEKYLQHQQDLYHVFIDFKKAFDRVWHVALLQPWRSTTSAQTLSKSSKTSVTRPPVPSSSTAA